MPLRSNPLAVEFLEVGRESSYASTLTLANHMAREEECSVRDSRPSQNAFHSKARNKRRRIKRKNWHQRVVVN